VEPVKQQELNFEKERPARGQIDQQEYALIRDKDGGKADYVHGTYEEVEFYCDAEGLWVDRYLDHVTPMTVQKHFKYVGSGQNPCATAVPFYNEKADPKTGIRGHRIFKEKF
jgi:hypothetical protein